MKSMMSLLVIGMVSATSALAAENPTQQCKNLATALVKATVSVTISKDVANEAQYSVTDYKSENKVDRVTVQAFALNGEDSDTYEEYEVALRKTSTSKKCWTLESMTLVGEN